MNQYELEKWWVDAYRSNGLVAAQKLRRADRVSSDPMLRRHLNAAAYKLHKRFMGELLTKRSRGPLSEHAVMLVKLTESIEGIALCHLLISAALNHLLGRKSSEYTLAAVGGSLTRAVEVELRIRFAEKVFPDLAGKRQASRGTFVHRNRALMTLMGRASRSGLPAFFADTNVRNKLGVALVEVLLLCPMFEPYLAPRGKQRIWCIQVHRDVTDRFNRSLKLEEFLSCVPPLGLYLFPLPAHRESREGLLLERRPLVSANWLSGQRNPPEPPPTVLKAIDRLNGVKWRVNVEMLEWIRTHESVLSARDIIPQTEFKIREGDDKAKAYDKWFKRTEPKLRLYRHTMIVAKKLSDSVFYHDWFLDFRGRMYTTSVLLSPQGNPLNKALIEFAEPVTFAQDGSPAYCEFVDYGLRMVFGKADIRSKSMADVAHLAKNAVAGRLDPEHLQDTKDYLPFVAWALVAVKLLNGYTVTTGLPLRRDATASSIQHMATMAADTDLMRLVNLTPTLPDTPCDLYTGLGAATAPSINLARSALKSFVMTYCYNSTAWGRARERLRAIEDSGQKGSLKTLMAEDTTVKESMSPILERVASLRDELSEIGVRDSWRFTSPSGIAWDGLRVEWPTRRIWVRYNDARIQVRLRTTDGKPEPNTRKSAAAYVANVVHSLDASMIHLCVEEWPESVAFIHDCVVTLPGSMDASCAALRCSFFRMHEDLKKTFSFRVAQFTDLGYDEYIETSKFMFI